MIGSARNGAIKNSGLDAWTRRSVKPYSGAEMADKFLDYMAIQADDIAITSAFLADQLLLCEEILSFITTLQYEKCRQHFLLLKEKLHFLVKNTLLRTSHQPVICWRLYFAARKYI